MNIINTKVVNGAIHVLNAFVTEGRPKTFLNASADATDTTITVFSISGFAAGNFYVQIGETGAGNAEIVKIHAATSPSGNTVTLAAGIANNHGANEPVYFIGFNRIEFSRATTVGGAKSVLATNNIDPSKHWTIYLDTNSTGFAYARFNNQGGSTFSSYSAPAPYAQANFNTIEYMTNVALRETKQEYDNEFLTPDYLLEQCNECLRDIRKNKNKMSFDQKMNAILGQTSRGEFIYPLTDLSDTIYDIYSFKAIDRVSLGGQPALIKVDPNYFFNVLMDKVHFTQVTTQANVGDVTLEIDNSYDFDDSGSVNVNGNTITYTGVTRSATAGVLTGVPASGTGSITATISVDDYVFQGETESEPKYYTLLNGNLYLWPLVDSSWDNFNINIDYYKTITSVDSMEDTIDYIQFDIVKNYLKWKIKSITKNDGEDNLNDPSFALYQKDLASLIKKERPSNVFAFRNNQEATNPNHYGDENPRRIRESSYL